MKTNLSLLFCMLYCAAISAQTNYYTATKTFYESGYTYQCDVKASGTVELYNKTNKWTYTFPRYKSTGEGFVMPDSGIDLYEDDNWTEKKIDSIVNNAFSAAEKQRVKKREFVFIMYINTNTGKVDEVEFSFVNFGPYSTIPVAVFRKIETDIKKEIWFTLTNEGRKLNFIYSWRAKEPK